MTVQEWIDATYLNPDFQAAMDVMSQFLLKEIQMTSNEEKILEEHIDTGKQRQVLIVDKVLHNGKFSQKSVSSYVERLMCPEPYYVFYRSYYLGEIAEFADIEECANKITRLIKSKPPYEDFITYAERWPLTPTIQPEEIRRRIEKIRKTIKET